MKKKLTAKEADDILVRTMRLTIEERRLLLKLERCVLKDTDFRTLKPSLQDAIDSLDHWRRRNRLL